jgi:hypothetical protein
MVAQLYGSDFQDADSIGFMSRFTAGVLGVDALGIGLGAGFGGFGGAIDGNFAGDAVTLFADMKEQSMAQVRACRLLSMPGLQF